MLCYVGALTDLDLLGSGDVSSHSSLHGFYTQTAGMVPRICLVYGEFLGRADSPHCTFGKATKRQNLQRFQGETLEVRQILFKVAAFSI